MKIGFLSIAALFLAFSAFTFAQEGNSPAAAQQNNGGGGYGQRGYGRGGFGGGMGMAGGRGFMGTVTEVAADHFMVKSETGETYTVHFSVNTRIMKQVGGMRGGGEGGRRGGGQGQGAGQGQNAGQGGGQGQGGGMERGGNPPQAIKATDIKVGDAIGAMGEVDTAAKSVGAVVILQMDPERAKQMLELQANYGKTWLQGKVTAIDGVKVTLMGMMDNAPHAFVADENTSFRKRRDPITLADIQVGDMVRAEGSVKDGMFTATAVGVMGMPPGGGPQVPRTGSPQ
jgi:hypothetical protein